MKIIIFGATGGTGKHIVSQAIEQGHCVTAFARHPENISISHTNLTLIKGDVLDNVAVENAVKAHEVVICVLGTPASDKTGLRASGTKNIIQAMQKNAVKRLICQSALGCGDSYNSLPFYYRFLIFPLILRHVLVDHENQEKHIKESQLDWVIVRPASLNNGELSKKYFHGFVSIDKTMKIKISRADTADFIIKQLADNTYLRKMPGLSY